MIQKEEIKHKECVKDLLLNLCSLELVNYKKSKTLEFTVICIQPDQKIFIELAFQVSEDKNID
jgi:hypothetical protein